MQKLQVVSSLSKFSEAVFQINDQEIFKIVLTTEATLNITLSTSLFCKATESQEYRLPNLQVFFTSNDAYSLFP